MGVFDTDWVGLGAVFNIERSCGRLGNIERSCGRLGGYAGWWFWLRSGQQRVSDPGRIRSGLQ